MKKYPLVWALIFGLIGLTLSAASFSFCLGLAVSVIAVYGIYRSGKGDLPDFSADESFLWIVFVLGLFFSILFVASIFFGWRYGKKIEYKLGSEESLAKTKKWLFASISVCVLSSSLVFFRYVMNQKETTEGHIASEITGASQKIESINAEVIGKSVYLHLKTTGGTAGTYVIKLVFLGSQMSREYLFEEKSVYFDANAQDFEKIVPVSNLEKGFNKIGAVRPGFGASLMEDSTRITVSLRLQRDDGGKLNDPMLAEMYSKELNLPLSWRCNNEAKCEIVENGTDY